MRTLALALLVVVAGCANSRSGWDTDPEPVTFGGGEDAGADGQAPPRPPGECAEDTKDIFVISEQNTLYSFHPPTLAFKPVGLLECPTGGARPTSMAVDRKGIAWVRHTDQSIWKVDTRTLACEPTTFTPPPPGGTGTAAFIQFGMGYSSSSKGSSQEELFLSDSGGAGLARLDTTTMGVSPVGSYTGGLEGKGSELTGTGDGKLYGFFNTKPAQVAEISKDTGEILTAAELPDVYAGTAWAFSFYGGDFYIYTNSGGPSNGPPRAGAGSDVTRYRPSDGSVVVVKSGVGFTIVGAGVSTCAPVAGPK